MNNFGVIEVASTKTTNAPGWAYVPDTAPAAPLPTPSTTTNRKRARNTTAANLSYADLNARQEAKIRKELETLDRDNQLKDVNIGIPPKPSGSVRRTGNGGKHTPNVRRILMSQKTFANHLDDYVALNEAGGGGSSTPAGGNGGGLTSSSRSAAISSRSRAATLQQQKRADTPSSRSRQKQQQASSSSTAAASSTKATTKQEEDTAMTDAHPLTTDSSEPNSSNTLLTPYAKRRPVAHPQDHDPLLVSRVPPMPSDDELRALVAAPALSYLEARAGWNDEDKKYPVRVFCEVCGYWGRVKCMKCGVRVCALECLETHREECVTRYGL